MLRLILSVLAGYIAIAVLVVVTDQIFAAATPGFAAAAQPPLFYFVVSLFTDTLYSVVGGYLCVTLARARARTATIALIALGELIGLVTQIALWNTVPHWFGFGLLILYPAGIWAGSRLRARSAGLVPA